jgi:hypothetical protein
MGVLVVLHPEGKVIRHNAAPVLHMSSWHGAKLSTGTQGLDLSIGLNRVGFLSEDGDKINSPKLCFK